MKRWIALAAATVTVAATVGVVHADASPTGQAQHQTKQPANPHPEAAAAATPLDTAVESKFTPITPCRVADTRKGGGAIAAAATRTFQITGTTGFTAQGGTSTGCGIPAAATSVSMTVIATGETWHGYITIYPNGAAKPLATALSYATADTRSSNTNATLGTNGQIRAYNGASKGSTHLVLDITGYYIRPMQAEVSSSGAVARGSRVTSATQLDTGRYQVDFDRDVTGCAFSATSYYYNTTVQVQPRVNDAHGVYVATTDPNGDYLDAYFYLTVTC